MITPQDRVRARRSRLIARQQIALADAINEQGDHLEEAAALIQSAERRMREATEVFSQLSDDQIIEAMAQALHEAASLNMSGPTKPWGDPSLDKPARKGGQSKHEYYRMLAGAAYDTLASMDLIS